VTVSNWSGANTREPEEGARVVPLLDRGQPVKVVPEGTPHQVVALVAHAREVQ
jgi:hypothetical protein